MRLGGLFDATVTALSLHPTATDSVFWSRAARNHLAVTHQELIMADATRNPIATSHTHDSYSSTNPPQAAPSACCGGPAPAGRDACCARDAEVKSTGGAGCGCGAAAAPAPKKTSCCG
jgi:hypothetical protein